MEIELLAFTDKGFALAERLAAVLGGRASRCNAPDSLAVWTQRAFSRAQALVFVGAAGIAVRAIAPYILHKAHDPAVVVVDECARFAVPILSGHLGGANALARRISACCGAAPVLTTATDANGVFAVDEWARLQGMRVLNPEKIKRISARLLAGGTVSLYSDWPVAGTPPECVRITADSTCDIRVSLWPEEDDALHLIPAVAVLGVGCRKGTACVEIERALGAFLAAGRVHRQAICKVCSIDLKKAEPGLTAFCAKHSLPFETYSAQQLAAVGGVFSASAFVQCVTGVDNVCERAAVCGSGGALYLKKFAGGGVTLAMALMPFAPDWRWQNG